MRTRRFFPLAALFVLILWQSHAANIVWTNSVGGNWNTAANWSPNQVPGAGDSAFVTNNGAYTVTVSADASASAVVVGGINGTQTLALNGGTFTVGAASTIGTNGVLSLSGGSLSGAGDVTILGTVNWSFGNMAGTGHTILASGGRANFTGAVNFKGLTRTFDNSGTVTYSGTTLVFGFGAAVTGTINNLTGGVFSVTGDGDFGQSSGTGHAFNNAGTFNKSGTNTTTDFTGVAFNNAGAVNLTSGSLTINGGGSNSVGSSRVDLQACKLEYSIVSPK